jgi:hypothetical protein
MEAKGQAAPSRRVVDIFHQKKGIIIIFLCRGMCIGHDDNNDSEPSGRKTTTRRPTDEGPHIEFGLWLWVG